jgi:hypothetical protein
MALQGIRIKHKMILKFAPGLQGSTINVIQITDEISRRDSESLYTFTENNALKNIPKSHHASAREAKVARKIALY